MNEVVIITSKDVSIIMTHCSNVISAVDFWEVVQLFVFNQVPCHRNTIPPKGVHQFVIIWGNNVGNCVIVLSCIGKHLLVCNGIPLDDFTIILLIKDVLTIVTNRYSIPTSRDINLSVLYLASEIPDLNIVSLICHQQVRLVSSYVTFLNLVNAKIQFDSRLIKLKRHIQSISYFALGHQEPSI